jgi:hypothetical protein
MSDTIVKSEAPWGYCTANGRAIPRDWHTLNSELANKSKQPTGGWLSFLPLILAAWDVTMSIERWIRFKEHIQWTNEQHQLTETGGYLRSQPDDQGYHFNKL